MSNPNKVEEIWTNIQSKDDPELEEDIEEIQRDDEDSGLKPGQKNEAWIFQESCSRQRDAVEGYWTKKGMEIRESYNKKSNEDKQLLLADARNIISQMGNGTYQNALMYCPELNPAKLSGIDTKKAPFCCGSFEELVEFVRKQKELPRIGAKNYSEIISAIKNPNYGDNFVSSIIKRLGSSQTKLLPLVAISRQHVLFVFCHLVFVLILGHPITTVTENIPGCSDESNSNPGENLNVPFSTKAQRDATPIGTPPIPNILKRKQEREANQNQNTEQAKTQQTNETNTEEQKEPPKSNDKSKIICSEPTCNRQQGENEKFQVCSFCKKFGKSIPYCSKDCQIQHWRSGHKKDCEKNKN